MHNVIIAIGSRDHLRIFNQGRAPWAANHSVVVAGKVAVYPGFVIFNMLVADRSERTGGCASCAASTF